VEIKRKKMMIKAIVDIGCETRGPIGVERPPRLETRIQFGWDQSLSASSSGQVTPGQSSVRNGEAGRPASFQRFTTG